MSLRLVRTIAALVLVGLAAGCGGDSSSDGEASAELVDRGAEVYAASGASCHGTDLEGTDRGPSHLSIVYEPNHHPDSSFRSAITNGAFEHHWSFGPMPPVEGLTDQDVDAVIAFVRAEQEARGFQR